MAAPAILFYIILFPFASRIPISDDYDAALGYLNQLLQLKATPARLLYVLTAQHNEYKLWFVNTLVWLQYRALGSLDLRLAALFSNLFALPVILVLWKLFLPTLPDTRTRLLLFFPAACLWFQLNFAETLDWAVSAYQTLPIITAVLLGFYLLVKRTRPAFLWALLCLPAAIGSSGNGFLFAAVGAVLLFRQRRFRALAAWSFVTAACAGLYAWHYAIVHSPATPAAPVLERLLARPAFILIWLGSAAVFHFAAPFLGLGLCAFWLLPRSRSFLRSHPAIACTLCFILLSACLVALGRAEMGLWSARASRYRIYSNLLLIFIWFALAARLIRTHPRTPLKTHTYAVAVSLAVIFAAGMDIYGLRFLRARVILQQTAMAAYQRAPPGTRNPVPDEPAIPGHTPWENHTRAVLQEAERRNLYHPPHL